MTTSEQVKVTTTDELRAAKKQRAFHSAKDYETSASQIGDIVNPDEDQRRKVAKLVAINLPKDQIIETLMMLGIHPDQPDFEDGPRTDPHRDFNAGD